MTIPYRFAVESFRETYAELTGIDPAALPAGPPPACEFTPALEPASARPLYRFGLENFRETYPEFEPLYRQHYAEVRQHWKSVGLPRAPFGPRIDEYFKASDGGWLRQYTARIQESGEPAGYFLVYMTNDMLDGKPIAQEAGIFVARAHRNGLGRRLMRAVAQEVGACGVTRLQVAAMAGPRVVKLWERMGYRPIGMMMAYHFGEE